jgi:hypothetical protein
VRRRGFTDLTSAEDDDFHGSNLGFIGKRGNCSVSAG